MATRTRGLIQDENLNAHFRDTNCFSKAKKAATGGLGGRKPLSTITNSGKPSPRKASKNHTKKFDNQEIINSQLTSVVIQNDHCNGGSVGVKSKASDVQKKAGVGGGRKALTNITNSRVSLHQESKKYYPKTLNDIGEEQCLHNHQECIKSQNKVMDMQFFMKTLGFDDGCSMRLSPSCLLPPEIDCFSPPKHLEYEEVPEMLNEDRSPRRCWTPDHHLITSPNLNRYISSPTFTLLESP